MNTNNDYIGDGVYVSFDGYHVNLAVNHHENHVVALEPDVLINLVRYAKRINSISDKNLKDIIDNR